MESHHCLIWALCAAIFILTVEISAVPIKTHDCDVPINLKEAECCSAGKKEQLKDQYKDHKCSSMLVDSEVLTYEGLESSLECFIECLFTNADMLDEDNKVIYDDIITNITGTLPEDVRSVSINDITKCYKEDYVVKETSKCKSGSLQFFLCVHREKILNCPAENWKNDDECNNYKSVLESCPKKTPIFHLFDSELDKTTNKTE